MRVAALLCALCAVVAACSLPAAHSTAVPGEALSLTAENINKVSDAFTRLLSDPYDLSSMMLPNDLSMARAGLRPETVATAEGVRAHLRQSLSNVIDIAANRTSDFVKAAQAELVKAGVESRPELLQRLSSIPVKFDAQGAPLVSNPLTAVGTFLVNTLQQQLKALRAQGGADLDSQLGQSQAGRKLLQEMDAFQAAAAADEELLDVTRPAHVAGPAAVARQLDRMMSFLTSLTDAADDLLGQFEAINKAAKGASEQDASAVDEDGDDVEGQALRQLRQMLPDPNDGYAQAARLIFSNVFDYFRANGLYGLVPLIADLRGIFTRYNWIQDLLNIIDAPLENFINANYVPLPQSNKDLVKLVQDFASNYCELEEASNSETVLGAFEGPSVSYEVDPVECPIYTDPDTGRNYVSFEDCSPATLTIKVNPLTITEVYFSAAKYKGTECKYVEPFGTDLTLKIGGGKQNFSFVRSAKGINIVPTVTRIDPRSVLRRLEPVNEVEPDSTINVNGPTVGNGFTASVQGQGAGR